MPELFVGKPSKHLKSEKQTYKNRREYYQPQKIMIGMKHKNMFKMLVSAFINKMTDLFSPCLWKEGQEPFSGLPQARLVLSPWTAQTGNMTSAFVQERCSTIMALNLTHWEDAGKVLSGYQTDRFNSGQSPGSLHLDIEAELHITRCWEFWIP